MDHLNVKHRAKGLKWLATPLVDHNHHEEHEMHSHGHGSGHHSSDESTPALKPNQEGYAALPEFHRHEEATNIELFFDLFFVANLAGFSNVHEINDKGSLTSYIGFFCVLWFTWCQVSLFDVRFVADSVMERLAKAIHLGVMVGLAVVGPGFDPGDQKRYVFRTMCKYILGTETFTLLTVPSADPHDLETYFGLPILAGNVACTEIPQYQDAIPSDRRLKCTSGDNILGSHLVSYD